MTPAEELERLIAEQQREMRRGHWQDGEPGVMHYMAMGGSRSIIDPAEAIEFVTSRKVRAEGHDKCPVHGYSESYLYRGTTLCRACNRDYQRQRARGLGRPERPKCPHTMGAILMKDCLECKREKRQRNESSDAAKAYRKRYYETHREQIRANKNRYRQRRYAEDPNYRAAEIERNAHRNMSQERKDARNARRRERYAIDPEYRQKILDRGRRRDRSKG